MRTEVKIGIAVGAVVFLMAVVYFGFDKGPQQQPAPEATQTPEPNRVDVLPTPAEPTPAASPLLSASQPASELPLSSVPVSGEHAGLPAPSTRPAASPFSRLTPESARPTGTAFAVVSAGLGTTSRSVSLPQGNVATTATPTSHVVQANDSYWSIAQKYYGNGNYHKLIEVANSGVALKPGQTIKIPPSPVDAKSAKPAVSLTLTGSTQPAVSAADGTTYIVASGDTLTSIAQKKLGSGANAPLLMKANPGVDPNKLRVGQKLVIPTRSGSTVSVTPVPASITPAPAVRNSAAAPSGGTSVSTASPDEPPRPRFR